MSTPCAELQPPDGYKAQTIRHLLLPVAAYLADPAVTEIRIRPHALVCVTFAGKAWHALPDLTFGYLRSLATAMIAYAGLPVRSVNYLTMPDGERCTVLCAPAVDDGSIVIVIRKHAAVVKNLGQLEQEGAFSAWRDVSFNRPSPAEALEASTRADFSRLEGWEVELLTLKRDGDLASFLWRAVALKRNIVIAGRTGSGKTTLTRSLIEEVPQTEHLVTIEDVHELALPNHKEKTHLFYGSGGGRISALDCLAACMRITPDRIFLAELRGAEAWEYTNALNTDHGGGITTTHANGAIEAFDRIATLVKNSDVGRTLDMEAIRHVIYTTVDVVLFMAERRVTQVFYDPIFKRAKMGGG